MAKQPLFSSRRTGRVLMEEAETNQEQKKDNLFEAYGIHLPINLFFETLKVRGPLVLKKRFHLF